MEPTAWPRGSFCTPSHRLNASRVGEMKSQVLNSLEKGNAVRPEVKMKLRHEPLKPQPLTERW